MILSSCLGLFGASQWAAPWWIYAVFCVPILVGLALWGVWSTEADRTGRQKWGDGSGGGPGA